MYACARTPNALVKKKEVLDAILIVLSAVCNLERFRVLQAPVVTKKG